MHTRLYIGLTFMLAILLAVMLSSGDAFPRIVEKKGIRWDELNKDSTNNRNRLIEPRTNGEGVQRCSLAITSSSDIFHAVVIVVEKSTNATEYAKHGKIYTDTPLIIDDLSAGRKGVILYSNEIGVKNYETEIVPGKNTLHINISPAELEANESSYIKGIVVGTDNAPVWNAVAEIEIDSGIPALAMKNHVEHEWTSHSEVISHKVDGSCEFIDTSQTEKFVINGDGRLTLSCSTHEKGTFLIGSPLLKDVQQIPVKVSWRGMVSTFLWQKGTDNVFVMPVPGTKKKNGVSEKAIQFGKSVVSASVEGDRVAIARMQRFFSFLKSSEQFRNVASIVEDFEKQISALMKGYESSRDKLQLTADVSAEIVVFESSMVDKSGINPFDYFPD